MADTLINTSNGNEELLNKLLREYTSSDSDEEAPIINNISDPELLCDYFKMVSISDTTTLPVVSDHFSTIENHISLPSTSTSEDDCTDRISLAYENLKFIPRKIAEKFASQTKFLDLSYNNFSNLQFLSFFKGLHTLILDRNTNLDETTFPYLPKLEILWMNNCNLKNIPKWIFSIQANCPNIRYLSIIGNPGAKNLYNGASVSEHNDYRSFITTILPTLIYLDDAEVQRSPMLNTSSAGSKSSYEIFSTASQSLRSLSNKNNSPRNGRITRRKTTLVSLKDSNHECNLRSLQRKRANSNYLSSSTT